MMAFCRYCGVTGYLYHRKTLQKEWRCRGCGYEFSQAEFEVFAEQLEVQRKQKQKAWLVGIGIFIIFFIVMWHTD